MLARLLRTLLIGVVVSTTFALLSAKFSLPVLQDVIRAGVSNLLEPYPELTFTIDGRDIAVTADPARPIPKDTADVLAKLLSVPGLHALSFGGGGELAKPLDANDPQLADAPAFNASAVQVANLSPGNVIDFSAVIQFVVAPTWSRSMTDDPCILTFGDAETTEFAICMSGDRRNITLQNENDFAYVRGDFTADRPYVVEVVVNDKLSEVFVDGVSIGTADVGFVGPSVQQLNVASFDGITSVFQGHIGRIRVWNRGDREGLSDIKVPGVDPTWTAWAPGFSRHHDNLVAYSKSGKDRTLSVVVLPKRTDPIGLWYAPEEVAIRRLDKEELRGSKFAWLAESPEKGHHGNYSSYKVLRITRMPSGDLEIWSDEGGSGRVWAARDWKKAEWLSRRTDIAYGTWPIDQVPPMTLFRSRPLLTVDDGEALILDGKVRLLPFAFKEPNAGAQKDQSDAWESTFVNPEQIKNWFYSFAGYDITQMNPINFGDLEGVRAPVFARPGPDNLDYKSTGEGRFAPAQMFFKPIFQAETENTIEIANTEREMVQSHARSLGANIGMEGVGSFGGSYTMSTKFEQLRSTASQTGYGETRVLHYVLVADKARVLLAEGFERDVQNLVLNVVERIDDSGKKTLVVEGKPDMKAPDWVKAPRQILAGPEVFMTFIDKYGTHYPYAITYGGKVHAEFQKKLDATKSSEEATREMKIEAEAAIEGVKLGGNFSATKGKGSTVGSENGTEITKTVVVGGRGSASLESFEVQDTVVPIYMDLRPLSELLSPVYFVDPFFTGDVRKALEEAIVSYRAKFPASDAGNTLRVALRLSKVTCVSDGDDTFVVGTDNLAPTHKLGPLNAALHAFMVIGNEVLGLVGAEVEDSGDETDTCELRGSIAAVLLKNNEIIDVARGKPAAIPPAEQTEPADTSPMGPLLAGLRAAMGNSRKSEVLWSGATTAVIADMTNPFVASWHADRDGGSNPLLIKEGNAFAITTTNPEAQLIFAIPRNERDQYRIGLVADLDEVDSVTFSKKDKVVKTDYFPLSMANFDSFALPSGQQVQTWSLKLRGKCIASSVFICMQAPFSARIEGEVQVEVHVNVLD